MKKLSYILAFIIILDLILTFIFDQYIKDSFILYKNINSTILVFIVLVSILNIIINLKKRVSESIDIICRSFYSVLFCINIGIFCYWQPPNRYIVAIAYTIVSCFIMAIFALVRYLIKRKRNGSENNGNI